jgi:DNA (cytosine-5)-methyltransferase 1
MLPSSHQSFTLFIVATKQPKSKSKTLKKPTSRLQPGLRVVSLFAGAGGLDIAFCETGRVTELVSTDSHPVFLQTVIQNLPKHFPTVRHSHLVADARKLVGTEICDVVSVPIDLVIGGPPCDDFTSFGLKRGMGGEKGPIIFEYARLIGEIKPRAFLFENVPNLQTMCTEGFAELLHCLSGHGYSVVHQTLAACDFGAPTVRQRLFVVGFRSGAEASSFAFPSRTHGEIGDSDFFRSESAILPFVTVGEALAGLPDVNLAGQGEYLNHTGRFHRPKTIEHIMTVPQGVAVSKSFRYRPPSNGLSRSLTAGLDDSTKSYLHPIYHREMSVREYARIHGFPDTWDFAGTRDNGIKQVANAVPIPLGRQIAAALAAVIDRNPGD